VDTSLVKAVLMNFFNPNVYIFWGTIGAPIVLAGWQQSPMAGWSFLIGFYFTIIPALALLITLFGTTNRLDTVMQRRISLLLAFVLLAFGFYQIWQGLFSLLA
jgi:threonine/homoserine/homoserine lactone efflux protein